MRISMLKLFETVATAIAEVREVAVQRYRFGEPSQAVVADGWSWGLVYFGMSSVEVGWRSSA